VFINPNDENRRKRYPTILICGNIDIASIKSGTATLPGNRNLETAYPDRLVIAVTINAVTRDTIRLFLR
jgi:hypothetical protein